MRLLQLGDPGYAFFELPYIFGFGVNLNFFCLNEGLKGGALLFLKLDGVLELPYCFLVAYFEVSLLRQFFLNSELVLELGIQLLNILK